MLKPFSTYNGVFIEITKSEHSHGGKGWEFGTCLWSPSKDRRGGDRYSLMLEPKEGDLILHFYHDTWPDEKTNTRLVGYSFVAETNKVVSQEPPLPGTWGNLSPYYRIELKNFTLFPVPLPFSIIKEEYADEILNDMLEDRPKYFLFNTYSDTIRTVQGVYLAKCTEKLFDLFMHALKIQVNINNNESKVVGIHSEYTESKRLACERYFFARNPKLVHDAKNVFGFKCQVCGFDFSSFYGKLGEGYIEAHHKNPLSERPDTEWTNEIISRVEDINVLCSNCHRMIHRKKPALTIEELINLINNS